MANPTIAAGFAKAFLEFAVSRGANRAELIERSQLRNFNFDVQDHRVPLPNYLALMNTAIELCREPALSLLFGEAVRMQDMTIVGSLGQLLGSVEEGLNLMNRYARLMLDTDDSVKADAVEFVHEKGDIWLKFTSQVYVDYPCLIESGVSRGVCGAREMLASIPGLANISFPKAIRFTHEEPSYRAEYDRIFRVPLFFGSNMNALQIDGTLLKMAFPRTNPYLSEVLKTHAENLLEKLESSKSTRGRVEGELIAALHTGGTSVELISRKLGVSRQTLFRQLKAEGATFEKVRDALRYKLHFIT